LAQLSSKLNIPLVATNDVHYHEPKRRQLQDILTCIREKCTIYNAGYRLHSNAERYLKSSPEMLRLFRQYPDAMQRTQELAEACQFSLDSLQYEYPLEITTEGRTAQEELTHLAWKGAKEIYGDVLPDKVIDAINHELKFIEQMNYASYFLTVYDIVVMQENKKFFAREEVQAANSTICFCLGITSVNPNQVRSLV
jgi:error-prone DNA polymerase